MDRAFLMDRYNRELDRKDKLTASVTVPVTILGVLGGATVAMARGFTDVNQWLTGAFIFLLVVDAAAILDCVYWLAKNYGGSTYMYLPRLLELEMYHQQVLRSEDTPEDGEREFENNFRERIINAADHNARVNDTRTAYMDRANQKLIAVLVATALCGAIYVAAQIVVGQKGI